MLFALFYLAVDTFAREQGRERVLDAALLGGLALSAGALVQYYFLGFDTLDNRPRSFLGHYMTASGLVMAVLVLAAARLAFHGLPSRRPAWRELRVLAGVLAGVALLTALQAADLFAVEAERLFVAGLAAAGAVIALLARPGRGAPRGVPRRPRPAPRRGRAAHLAHPQRLAGRPGRPGVAGRAARAPRAVGARRQRSPPSWSCGPRR